eukprot:scaffold159268_cov20-Tisochrysis_lutea.AAC.3
MCWPAFLSRPDKGSWSFGSALHVLMCCIDPSPHTPKAHVQCLPGMPADCLCLRPSPQAVLAHCVGCCRWAGCTTRAPRSGTSSCMQMK